LYSTIRHTAFQILIDNIEYDFKRLNRKLLIHLMDLPAGPSYHIHLARISVILETVGKINDQVNKTINVSCFSFEK
jgi:hypothetical protein